MREPGMAREKEKGRRADVHYFGQLDSRRFVQQTNKPTCTTRLSCYKYKDFFQTVV